MARVIFETRGALPDEMEVRIMDKNTQTQDKTTYCCPMHPDVREDKPGACPKCGMKLEPEEKKK